MVVSYILINRLIGTGSQVIRRDATGFPFLGENVSFTFADVRTRYILTLFSLLTKKLEARVKASKVDSVGYV